MPCYVEPPSCTKLEWLRHMLDQAQHILDDKEVIKDDDVEIKLCSCCRRMSMDQMRLVNGLDIYQSLWMWYPSHLLSDYKENYENEIEREFYENEAKRIGAELSKCYGGFQIK